MNTLTENNYNENTLLKTISAFCKAYSVGSSLKKANAYKSKGIPILQIFSYLLNLVYTKKSMYMNIMNGSHSGNFARDVVYRLLNSQYINWSAFLLNLTSHIIATRIAHLHRIAE